ncbi:MAG: hydrogenase iron-sulfur subunit [Desulfobacteraceae bacterium]|nr:hydrogenase iron-sulfur subunit [Desulfobacteraceae bacterium]
MNYKANIGVFLCQCGNKIKSSIDLEIVKESFEKDSRISHCEILPYPCQTPGMDMITGALAEKKLNRLIVAGCESRLMLKKFENAFAALELRRGQIDIVNLRGHVATVSDLTPADKAAKSIKLINGAIAEMQTLVPTGQSYAQIDGPIAILGCGMAGISAARELSRKKMNFFLVLDTAKPDRMVQKLHHYYPGERSYERRFRDMVREVFDSEYGTILSPFRLVGISGVTGDYTLTLQSEPDETIVKYKAGAIIASLDAEMGSPGPQYGHDGLSVMIQPEMENLISGQGAPEGQIVFWVNDYETGQSEFAQLSAKSAWKMACHIRECSPVSQAIILYHEQMQVPLTAAERAINRKHGILWVAYDGNLRPTIQDGLVTFCNLTDHVERDLPWDYMVLSPVRHLNGKALDTAKILGLVHQEQKFLTGHHARVRPEMVGREETYLAGSARYPCDLLEALSQGQRAGSKTTEMLRKSANGELMLPRIVCVVDPDKCIGCGQCQELCDCGGIGVEEGPGGGLPRVVDPMVCTGGGTCAAACPYHALVLQNNSNDQREARVAALAGQLTPDETLAIGCVWGGLPAADNAGKMGLKYDPRVHIMGVNCIGQIDPCVMARAFVEGASGLILVGCNPEACHHSYGLDHAWSRVNVVKRLLTLCGFSRDRIALAHSDLNHPEEFVRTVESFNRSVAMIGPIERSKENVDKLNAIYNVIKFNTRIRHLLSANLRRPKEKDYRGDQQHALEYDRDFTAVIKEEFLQHRLLTVLENEKRPLNLQDLVASLNENEIRIADCLWSLVSEGTISMSHENRQAVYHF